MYLVLNRFYIWEYWLMFAGGFQLLIFNTCRSWQNLIVWSYRLKHFYFEVMHHIDWSTFRRFPSKNSDFNYYYQFQGYNSIENQDILEHCIAIKFIHLKSKYYWFVVVFCAKNAKFVLFLLSVCSKCGIQIWRREIYVFISQWKIAFSNCAYFRHKVFFVLRFHWISKVKVFRFFTFFKKVFFIKCLKSW